MAMDFAIDENQLAKVKEEIHGLRKSDSELSIQLQKLDKFLENVRSKTSNFEVFDRFS